ncbi:MAG: acyl-CoA thioesterase [Bacteroidaceae bacterium]|nr:acyl-CoA thioesterase [Bacteroidaceae bacterium]
MEQNFKHEIPLQLRFNDIDILGHLNNSVYFNFFDLGKSRYFETVRGEKLDWHNADIVIASIHADFIAPVFFSEPVAVQTKVTGIGNKSFKMLQQIINTQTKQIKCICTSIMVGFDIKTASAKEISEEWKQDIIEYEGRNDLIMITMTKVQPINPNEIINEKIKAIPDQVIRVFNELIARNWNNDRSIVFANEAIEFIKFLTGASKDTIIQNHWLDVEPLYKKNGYEVTYHESQADQYFPSYYEFRKS